MPTDCGWKVHDALSPSPLLISSPSQVLPHPSLLHREPSGTGTLSSSSSISTLAGAGAAGVIAVVAGGLEEESVSVGGFGLAP
jgi:hypothetical protein